MNKLKLCVIVVAALLSASPVHSKPIPPFSHEAEAIVRITCKQQLGIAVGTAFHIGGGKYATAFHVINECLSSYASVIYDAKFDYAVFSGPVLPKSIAVDCSGFKSGQEYLGIGYAHGTFGLWFIPVIASKFSQEGYQSFVGDFQPGMSGGPVLGEDGKARGVVNMRWPARSQELRDTHICKGK